VVYSIQNCDETGDFEWTKSDILDNMFHVSLLLTFCTSALGTQEICCPKWHRAFIIYFHTYHFIHRFVPLPQCSICLDL